MKFLFISDVGNILGTALKVQADGNEVALWIKDPVAEQVGDNLVEEIHDFNFEPDLETVWMFDTSGFGHFAESLRRSGYPVVDGSLFADRLEMDRKFARQFMEEAGIQSPPSKTFNDWNSARSHVKAAKQRLVFKPSGHLSGNLPSYVSDGSDDMLGMIDYYERKNFGETVFELQEFIAGVDISTELWFDGERAVYPANHTLETKHVMDGDRGPSGGCAGNLIWGSDDWIVRETVERLVPLLERHHTPIAIDVNAIVSGKKLYGLEITPRLGYDSWPTMAYTLLDMEVGKFLSDFARGQLSEFPIKQGYGGGIRVSISPWPAEEHSAPAGLPVNGLTDQDLVTDFYPYDLMCDQQGKLVTAGSYGIIGVACACSDSCEEAMNKASERAKRVQVSDSQFRMDLGKTFEKDLGMLGLGKTASKRRVFA